MLAMPLGAGTLASLYYCLSGLCSESRHRLFILIFGRMLSNVEVLCVWACLALVFVWL